MDKPNKPKLVVTLNSVNGSGGSKMSFKATTFGTSKHFSENSSSRTLYNGDYTEDSITITTTGRERGESDDSFQSDPLKLSIDLDKLIGQGEATVTMTSEDKKDKENANYTLAFSYKVIPALEITDIDVEKNEITFDVLPEGLGSGTLKVVVTSKAVGKNKKQPDVKWTIEKPIKGGKGQKIHFDWTQFEKDPTLGAFHASSVTLLWDNTGGIANDVYTDVPFICYGQFRISRFVTPDDGAWTGPTEGAMLGADKQIVHTTWIDRVRGSEGKGLTNGKIVRITSSQTNGHSTTTGLRFTHVPGTQKLFPEHEGKWAERLTTNKSLAKHKSDTRFNGHDRLLLSTDPGTIFEIEDTGNWSDETHGRRVIDHLDRYSGFASPSSSKNDFGTAYVIKLLKKKT